MHPWQPYLAVDAIYHFSDVKDGNESLENGGYLLKPGLGLLVDVNDKFSLEFGVDFTLSGKNQMKSWDLHLSFTKDFEVN